MEAMGKKGLQEVAAQNAQKSAYAKKQIAEISGFSIPFSSPTFNEFTVRASKNANEILEKLRVGQNIIGGLPLSWHFNDFPNDFLVCVTETNTKEQIDNLAAGLKSIV
jgi:glycine dehydrogenase subunit 1